MTLRTAVNTAEFEGWISECHALRGKGGEVMFYPHNGLMLLGGTSDGFQQTMSRN